MFAGRRQVVVLLLVTGLLTSTAQSAEPPKISRLVPAGGQCGSKVNVRLSGSAGDGDLKVWSKPGQLQFEFSEKRDTATVTIPADAPPGRQWLRFYNQHGATKLLPFVVGLVAETQEEEPNNLPGDAQAVSQLPQTINGVLEKSGEVDIYAVNLTAGRTLIVSTDAHRSLGSPMDAVLQLLDEHGIVIDQNDDDHGFDPQIVYRVPRDGTYFVRTFAFPATPNSTIRLAGGNDYVYRLTLTDGPFVDHCEPAAVSSADGGRVTLFGWNFGKQPPVIEVPPFDDSAVTLAAPAALPLTVVGSRHPVVVESSDDKQLLAVPFAVTGTIIQPREQDVFTIAGKKGQTLAVSVAARSLHSPLDPVVIVASEAGKVIKESDDRSREDQDAEAVVKLPADGSYTITVKDRYGHGGERFAYVLTCEESQPRFSATLKSTEFILPADKPLEIPVAVTRSNGFSEPIEFGLSGLPDGVTAEPVVSAPKGETAKSVTLKLTRTENAATFSGVIHVQGTVAESGRMEKAAAAIPNAKATTSDVWLTVAAAE